MGFFSSLARPFQRALRSDSRQLGAGGSGKAQRQDGWGNIITGLAGFRDKRMGGFNTIDLITDIQARDMWRGDDIAKRVIELLPREAMRKAYVIKAENKAQSEAIHAAAESLDVDGTVRKADMYERAYGGSAIFPVMEGALGDLKTPLSEDNITKILALHVLEPRELYPVKWYADLMSPKFGKPEVYRCIPLFAGGIMSAPMLEIHESRLVIFPGVRVTRLPQAGTLLGWGDNALTVMAGVLRDFGLSWGTASALLQDFSQAVLQIEGLDQIAVNDQGAVAKARLEQIMLVRSFMNAIVIDAKDKFERKQTPMNGLSELLQQFATRLAAAADMPVTLLMGMAPAGLNATGESDRAFWFDRVSAHQHYLTPIVQALLRMVMLATEGPTDGIIPEQWSIEWKPLSQPTEKEVAETRYIVAQTDDLNIGNGIYSGEDAARSHYGGDTYSPEIVIDWEARAAQLELEAEQDALALQASLMKPDPIAPGGEPDGDEPVEPDGDEPKPAAAKAKPGAPSPPAAAMAAKAQASAARAAAAKAGAAKTAGAKPTTPPQERTVREPKPKE